MKCCEYKAGDLRHIMTLEELYTDDDGYGGKIHKWRAVNNIMAGIKQKSHGARWWADKVNNVEVYEVLTRYTAQIKPNMRLMYGSNIYTIIGINNVEMADKWLVITCEAGTA